MGHLSQQLGHLDTPEMRADTDIYTLTAKVKAICSSVMRFPFMIGLLPDLKIAPIRSQSNWYSFQGGDHPSALATGDGTVGFTSDILVPPEVIADDEPARMARYPGIGGQNWLISGQPLKRWLATP